MYGLSLAFESLGVSNFAGVKYTGLYTYPGLMDALRLHNYKEGKYEVLVGRDELMIEALSIGLQGFVGSQYNMVGDVYNQIRKYASEHNHTAATQLQVIANEFIYLQNTQASPGVNGCKNMFNLAPNGVQVGESRLPSVPLSDTDQSVLREGLKAWCNGPQVESLPKQAKVCQGV